MVASANVKFYSSFSGNLRQPLIFNARALRIVEFLKVWRSSLIEAVVWPRPVALLFVRGCSLYILKSNSYPN